MRFLAGALALFLIGSGLLPAQSSPKKSPANGKKSVPAAPETAAAPPPATPSPVAAPAVADPVERLTYNAEWRMIHAGTAQVDASKLRGILRLDSAGLVSALFKIHDVYTVDYAEPFCASNSLLDSIEGKRHHETKVTFDRTAKRASFLERDLLKDSVIRSTEVEIPGCVPEVLGALIKLRSVAPPLGQSTQITMSDGRRTNSVKIDAQERETVKTPTGSFNTVRYEAGMLNGVVYTRKGRLFIWLTDDARHLPVQIRLKLPFPIGTVTLQLQKEEHL